MHPLLMISERTSLLLQSNTRWHDKQCNEEPTVKVSLSDRLSSLTTSADRWKSRVERDKDLESCRPVGRNSKNESVRRSHVGPLTIDQGLSSFFTPNKGATIEETTPDNVDLDVIAPTQKLQMIRKTPVARPQKRMISRRDESKDKQLKELNLVKPSLEGVNEDVLVFSVSEDLNEPVAKSARDGLSSIADYSETKKSLRAPLINESPYPDRLLVQVGGDDVIDVRSVIISTESVHDAASYLLITPSSLIIHHGEQSKVLERSKVMQVASSILHTKQLNCTATKVERTCENDSARRQFFRILELTTEKSTVVTGDEMIKKNRVFSIDTQLEIEMVVVGQVPCHSLLDPSKCLIFDFHSELYIWSGRDCRRSQSMAGEEYANQMQSQLSSFLFIRKISQGIPDVLFSSKFVNWPMDALSTSRPQKTPIRVDKRYKWKTSIMTDASSIACHLLRGEEKRDEIVVEETSLDGTDENVITERKDFWRMEGDELKRIEETNEWNRDSCYVLRWQYRVETRVGRLFGREKEEERETGRERIAFFYWLGRKSGVKEQGMTALRLSEMDKTKSPHIRMEEGAEPSIFLSLFNGLFTVRDKELNDESNIFLVLSKSHGRTTFSQMDSFLPLRGHGTYVRQSGGRSVIIAGVDSDIKDVRAAFSMWNGSSQEMECIVQGDDSSIEWIDAKEGSNRPRMYRVLGTESDIVHPSRPATSFPYSQSSLSTNIVVDCGKNGWLWSEEPLSDITLNVASIMANQRKFPVEVIEKGREPREFKALFPLWNDEGDEKEGMSRKLEEVIEERMSLTPVQVIQRRNEKNEMIDIESIEKNLTEEMFEEMYGMSRDHFTSLPQWKQLIVRKEKGFF